ncbi:MAG: exo-alpha-sialidase [Akkermansia sp.]
MNCILLRRVSSLLPVFAFALSGMVTARATEGFETFNQGKFTTLDSEYGKLSCKSEHAEIIGKAKSGQKSLHLLGGAGKTVELSLKESPKREMGMSAWAERWSGKSPFSFKIIAQGPYGDKEIYDGSKAVKTGGFSTKIEAKIPIATQKLLFLSDTADGTGVMLDDLYIVPSLPMKMGEVTSFSSISPAMIRSEYNPVVRIDVETEGGLKPLMLDGVFLNFMGTDMKDIASIQVVKGGEHAEDQPGEPAGVAVEQFSSPKMVKIPCKSELESGVNHFWINVRLKDTANIDHKIVVKPLGVIVQKKPIKIKEAKEAIQRIGYGIAMMGDQVMPTKRASKFYRIPGMVRSKKGTLIAACDIRYNHGGDLPADIDVGVSRSLDGGQTWSPMTIAIPFKDAVTGYKGAGNGDIAILVDEKTGRLWMAALWCHGGSPLWASSPGDTSPKVSSQLIISSSDDDGKTWSKPINITDQIKDQAWGVIFQGPGNGICLKDGTLVFPCQFWMDIEKNGKKHRTPHSSLIYSKDGGKTWTCGTACREGTSEAQVVELADSSIMINARNENRSGYRVIYVTKDLGKTWQAHSTNDDKINGLMEPGACQASIIAVPRKGGVERALFFSNPNSHNGRRNMTLKVSTDQGRTWEEKNQLLYDERGGSGYSSLAPINDQYIGVFYEGSGSIYFLRFPYKEIFKK